MESNIYFKLASLIRIGEYIITENRPCKVVGVTTSKTGKHGGCKCHFIVVDIFTGRKYEPLHKSTDNVAIPVVTKTDYQLCDIFKDDDEDEDKYSCALMNNNKVRDDLYLSPGELVEKILAAVFSDQIIYVTVLGALNIEQITGFRIEK